MRFAVPKAIVVTFLTIAAKRGSLRNSPEVTIVLAEDEPSEGNTFAAA